MDTYVYTHIGFQDKSNFQKPGVAVHLVKEVNDYCDEVTMTTDTNVLQWWIMWQSHYPSYNGKLSKTLSVLVQQVCCPSEGLGTLVINIRTACCQKI